MNILHEGKTNNFWSLGLGSRQLQGDFPFLQEIESYARFEKSFSEEDVKEELEMNIPWDCFCGFGIFGKPEFVRPVFDKIKQLMIDSGDEEGYDEDLLDETNPTRLALYNVPNSNVSVVIGAGYYVDTTKEMLEILKDKSVYSLGSGANFGTGDMNPIEDFVEASKEDSDFPEELRFLASYFKESKNKMKF